VTGESRSEIRDSDIIALADRVTKEAYQKYLRRMTLVKVRGFNDRRISFDFPVTALIGPNGGGKTTVLGAAGIIYRSVQPRLFFAKSGKYDQSMQNWSVEYDVIDRELARSNPQRTASFRRAKWNRTALTREVRIFGVARTVPATERRDLAKAVGSGFTAKSETQLDPAVVTAAERVLGKPMTGYASLGVDSAGKVTLYAASTARGTYSEFHFGAGEASIIKIITGVEAALDNSLILIEEIENGLHPVATQRLVEYLIDAARRKSVQVIFTTHSNDALVPLPPNAIWAAYNGELLQGKLDVRALRTITGQVEARLAIFVEDDFAELMVATALRQIGGIELDAIKIHGMGGAVPARTVNHQHNIDPTRTFDSICILDGDQAEDPTDGVFRLPGATFPENYVFDFVITNLDTLAAKLTVMLGLRVEQQEWAKGVVKSRALTNVDRHLIFEQIGEDLGFLAGLVVKNAFLTLWAQTSEDVQTLVTPFLERLPRRS
jgi:predicted ATPase